MKKNIVLLSLTLLLSACGSRNVLDELNLIKYQKLQLPTTIFLPKPNAEAKSLGYQSAHSIVKSTIGLQSENKFDVGILNSFKINLTSNYVKDNLFKPSKKIMVVDVEQEIKRINDNKTNGRKVTFGSTPSLDLNGDKMGIDELFE